jgi:nucleoside-diphosphate-sugar epimerase
MKRVLVTGATGFIGRHSLAPLVAQGYEVHAITRSGKQTGAAIWHNADLLNSEALVAVVAEVRPTHLLHFAWYAVSGKYWTAIENFHWVRATLELLQAFADNGGERAVCAGTCAEYDWRYGKCQEDLTPLHPATTYGICKSATVSLTDAFARTAKISAAWGRIFLLYGPHEHPNRLVSSVIRSLLRNEAARTSHGQQIRDILHVQDVAEAFVALLDSEVQGAVNIASGQPVALREVVTTIGHLTGKSDRLEIGALPAAENDPLLLTADTRRLRKEVGWKPRLDLAVGLQSTVDWWRTELQK